jgi:hypothetical chaperone protein
MSYYAIDFGTSNSLLNYISSDGVVTSVPLERDGSLILRSILFTAEKDEWFFGNEAIDEYMDNDGEGRFFRSLKKFLPEPHFKGTEVHNKKMNISELISVILREMRIRANKHLGVDVTRVIMGRPAKYSLDTDCDKIAEDRMREACKLAGFTEIQFCPEPLAAGLDYDKNNTSDKVVLIADFGGGTSDFTLMKLHSKEYTQDDILGISGLFKAGDALDGQMMLKFIARHFGSDFEYKIPMGNNVLKFPKGLLKKLGNPAYINHLKERDTWEFLNKLKSNSLDEVSKKAIDQLFTLVECQLGFQVFNEIEKSKIAFSDGVSGEYIFSYKYPGIDIEHSLTQTDYEDKMSPVVLDIIKTMMEVFETSSIDPSQVDQVCITGGTGQFSMIQKQLKSIFGEDKIIEHDIFESVVGGLSEYAKKQLS